MRVAHIVCKFPPYQSGMGNAACEQAIGTARNNQVVVFALNGGLEKVQHDGFKTVWLKPWLKIGNGGFCFSLLWQLRDFDIIQLHYPFFGGQEIIWFGKKFGFFKKQKLLIYYHMDVEFDNFLLKILSLPSRLLQESLFKMAGKIACSTIDYVEHADIKNIYKKNKNKFVEIPFGARQLSADSYQSTINKQKLDISADEKIVLFVGNLDKAHYFKGVDVLIRAFSYVIKKNEKTRLIVVGAGNLLEKYKACAAKENSLGKIIFAGKTDDRALAAYYQMCDICVAPAINKSEAFSLTMLEAKSFGKAVIASDLPGVRQVASFMRSGFLVKPCDAADLAQKMAELLKNDQLRLQMGKAGIEQIKAEYNWQAHTKKLETVYKSI